MGPRRRVAFNQLKQRLTSASVLGMPTDVGTFYLDCDASDAGLGSVLSQEQGGSEVVVVTGGGPNSF